MVGSRHESWLYIIGPIDFGTTPAGSAPCHALPVVHVDIVAIADTCSFSVGSVLGEVFGWPNQVLPSGSRHLLDFLPPQTEFGTNRYRGAESTVQEK